MDKDEVLALIKELGFSTTLTAVTKTRAVSGGAVTTTTQETSVAVAVDTDQSHFEAVENKRAIQLYLAGGTPNIGDLLTVDGAQRRVEDVDAMWSGSAIIAWKVLVS